MVQYMKYTNEYIPKLQIHQHSLLTRKVFSRHNLSAQVLFSVSFGSSSSHLHQIWSITGSSSSLDHHCWIITGAISILLVTGSSTEPALFHAGCKPSLHVGLH